MIYKKEASFPHPVYYDDTSSYQDCVFEFDIINLREGKDSHIFIFEYELHSEFLRNLLRDDEVFLNIIIQLNDNYFKRIKYSEIKIEIPKNRSSLNENYPVVLSLFMEKEDLKEQTKLTLSLYYNED